MSNLKKIDQYNRRRYTVEGGDLEQAKLIRITIELDGKKYVQVQAREPGMIAFVSRPDEQGFDVEIVEASGRRHTDRMLPDGGTSEALAPWQIDALQLEQ